MYISKDIMYRALKRWQENTNFLFSCRASASSLICSIFEVKLLFGISGIYIKSSFLLEIQSHQCIAIGEEHADILWLVVSGKCKKVPELNYIKTVSDQLSKNANFLLYQ